MERRMRDELARQEAESEELRRKVHAHARERRHPHARARAHARAQVKDLKASKRKLKDDAAEVQGQLRAQRDAELSRIGAELRAVAVSADAEREEAEALRERISQLEAELGSVTDALNAAEQLSARLFEGMEEKERTIGEQEAQIETCAGATASQRVGAALQHSALVCALCSGD
jgi:chromosome segregation ATPase